MCLCTNRGMQPAGASILSLSEQERERINRAHDFFGDPVQRRNDRLHIQRSSLIENYRSGQFSLVLDCDLFPFCFEKGVSNSLGEGVQKERNFVHDWLT